MADNQATPNKAGMGAAEEEKRVGETNSEETGAVSKRKLSEGDATTSLEKKRKAEDEKHEGGGGGASSIVPKGLESGTPAGKEILKVEAVSQSFTGWLRVLVHYFPNEETGHNHFYLEKVKLGLTRDNHADCPYFKITVFSDGRGNGVQHKFEQCTRNVEGENPVLRIVYVKKFNEKFGAVKYFPENYGIQTKDIFRIIKITAFITPM